MVWFDLDWEEFRSLFFGKEGFRVFRVVRLSWERFLFFYFEEYYKTDGSEVRVSKIEKRVKLWSKLLVN